MRRSVPPGGRRSHSMRDQSEINSFNLARLIHLISVERVCAQLSGDFTDVCVVCAAQSSAMGYVSMAATASRLVGIVVHEWVGFFVA